MAKRLLPKYEAITVGAICALGSILGDLLTKPLSEEIFRSLIRVGIPTIALILYMLYRPKDRQGE